MKPAPLLLHLLAGSSLVFGSLSRATAQYFDGGALAGLDPAPVAVNWGGSFWQGGSSPPAGAPAAWMDGGDAYFQTGGVNLVNVSGTITVYDLLQSGLNTATSIGGTGTLNLIGGSLLNESGSALQFLDGLTLSVVPQNGDTLWDADGSDIVVDAVLAGTAGNAITGGGILKTGSGTLYLNKANTYDGYFTLTEGTLVVGNASALGAATSRLVFNGGTLRYATGITEDFSDQFDPFAGAAAVDTNGNNVTFATALTGNGSFTKKGQGTLSLGAAATYTGGTTVEAGVLKIASGAIASALGSSTSVTVMSGATLDTNSNTGTGTKYDITVSGTGVAGLAALWNSGGGSTNSSIWKKITLAGNTTIGGANRYDVVGTIDFVGGTYTLTKVGTNQLTWSPSTATVGDIVIDAGNFTVQGSAVGSTDYSFVVNSAGTLSSWQTPSNNKKVQMNGGIWTSSGSGVATTITWGGAVTINNVANNRINPATDRHMKLTGQVTGAGGFTVNGGGILYLVNSTNNFSGGLTLTAGTVQLSDGTLNGALGAASNAITVNGGVLDLYGTTQTVGALAGTGGNIQNNRTTTTALLKAGSGGANGSYAGVIRDNSGTGGTMSFEKVGTGRQILTGVHTYTGTTTVTAGTLQIGSGTAATSTARTGTGAVSVAATGRISGNGILGSSGSLTTVAAGGFLSVGNFDATAAQTLTVAGAFTSSGTLELDVWTYGAGAGSTSDRLIFGSDSAIDISGTLVLTNLTGNVNWALGDTLRIFDWTAVTAGNRNVNVSSVDMSSFGTLAAGYKWDASRLEELGIITLAKDVLTGALRWDAGSGSTGAQDGGGVWNTSNTSWWDGSTNTSFENGDRVVFGAGSGMAGAVQVAASGVAVQDITFEPAGSGEYHLQGPGAITLQPDSWITTTADATIDAVLAGAGAGFTKSGAGRLTLTAANTYTGTTQINQGVLVIENTRALGAGGAVSILFNGGALSYARGLVIDYSGRFGAIGAGGAVIDTNGNNLTFAGVLTGSGTLTKTGAGRLYLTGDNAAYAGQIIVDQGILALGHSNAAGLGTSTADGLVVRDGATLDLSYVGGGTIALTNERIFIAGQGVGYLGAIMKNGGTGVSINQVVMTGHTTVNANVRWDFDANMDAQGFSVTKIGSSDLPWEGGGGGSRNLGNVYVKQGSLNFSGSADMGYFDSVVYGNTVYVNSGTSLTFYAKGTDDKRITLQGGILRRNGGAATEAAGQLLRITGGLDLKAGHASIQHGQSQLVFQLGAITRSTGGTLDIQDTSALTLTPTLTGNPVLATTSSTNSNGILGGWFTYGGNTWAVNSTDLANGAVVGLATGSYSSTFSAGANVDVAASQAVSGASVNSLRFATASAVTLTLSGSNTLTSGGLLVTSAVGANALSITGGTLRGSAAGELFIHQNNTGSTLTISSVVENNTTASSLIKTGAGTLILSGVNTYTGNTYISGSAGGGSTGILQVGNLQATGNDNLGATSNQIYFNNGTLRYSGASNAELARTVNLLSGGGILDVATSGVVLTVSGKVTGEALAADEGHFYGQGALTKNGNGILILTNGTNNYTGTTTVNAGILRLSGAGRLGADIARLTVNSGGVLELNGTSQSVGLLMGSAGGIIRNGGGGSSKLTIGNDDATYVANGTQWGAGSGYAGIIEDGASGTTSLAKTGAGYQILSGASTYSGTTEVLEGTLQVGAGTGAGGITTARTGTGLHTVSAGATLAGNGVIGGDTVIQTGGLLSVGNFGQTAAQTLTFNAGLVSTGTISLDVWSVSSVDQVKFSGTAPVSLTGRLIVNNGNTGLSWQVNESLKLFDWGSGSIFDRYLEGLLLDVASLNLANSTGTYWDTSRLRVDGTLIVLANALTWDSNTGTIGAQDGTGTWTVDPDTHWWNGSANVSFVSDGTQNVIFGTGGGAGGTVTINTPGGIKVNNLTFKGIDTEFYTIAGTGADGTLTVTNNAWITTNHAYLDSLGTTISAVMAGTGGWTKSGGGRLILTGANTFTGAVNVAQGVLDIRHATALGTTAGNTTVMSGATLEVRGSITVAENLVLNGSGHQVGADGLGSLRNQAGNNTFSGSITLSTTSQVTSRTGTLTLSGAIGGAGGLVITGEDSTSIVHLQGSGANTYTGGTTINSGILRLGKNQYTNAIAASTQVYVGDGTGGSRDILRLAQHDQIADAGTVLNFRGTGSQAGVFQLFGFNETVGTIRSSGGEGIIENGNSGTSTLTVNNATNDTFSGILQNGGGILALTKINNGILTLTGAGTYSGATTVRAGVLELAGGGSLNVTGSVAVTTGGILRLSNTAAANSSNRLNDGAAVSLTGARLEFSHTGGAASYAETAGALVLESGASTVATSQAAAGQGSTLTFASLTRSNNATVDFSGTGLGLDNRNQVLFAAALSGLDHGMIGAWATAGNNFARYGSFGVTAMTDADYALGTAESSWKYDQNVKQTGGFTLSADRVINSLNLAQASGAAVNLGGHTLRIESGGLLVSGDFDSSISGGSLTAGTSASSSGELVIHQNSAGRVLTVSASITDNGTGAVGVTKSGTGTLVLSGANSFTGGLTLNAGIVRLDHADALADGNRVAVEGGTLDLNGNSITVSQLSSAPTATAGVITNGSATAVTLNVGADGSSSAYYGVIQDGTGKVSLTKTGTGELTLGGNSTYTGVTNVNAGKLIVAHVNALGNTASANNTIVASGATLEIAAEGTYNETLTIAGEGVNRLGALTLANVSALRGAPDQVRVMNLVLAGAATINNGGKRLDLDGVLQTNGHALTKIGLSQVTYEGTQNTGLGDLYIKQGDFTFGSGTGVLGDASKTVYVNSGATFRFYNVNAASKNITLRGGTWIRDGSSSPTTPNVFRVTGGLKLEAGASAITHQNTNQILHLETLNRDTGATLNLSNTGSAITTDTTNTNGIVGGYLTWGGNTWAVSGDSGTDITLSGLATGSYQANNFTAAANNVDVTSSQSPAPSFTVNTLRFNTGAAVTLTLQGTNVISSGGILVTSGVGSFASKITGGTLVGSTGAAGDLIIHQNNTGASFTIESVIANNGAFNTALTKTGGGRLVLTANNTYSGGTYITGAAGGGTRGVLSVSKISDTGDSNLGQSSGGSNALSFNNGTLEYTGTVDAQTGRNVVLLSGGGEFSVTSGSATLTLNGVISNPDTTATGGFYAAENTLTKSGSGTLVLGGTAANTYTGDTIVNGGVLLLMKTAGVNAVAGGLTVNAGGTLRLGASNQIHNSSVVSLAGSGKFDLNGESETVGGLSGTGGAIGNDGGNASVLTVNVAAGQKVTYAGTTEDGLSGLGGLSLVKEGEGTQVLTGANNHTGTTTINQGTLELGDGGSLLYSNVEIAADAELRLSSSSDGEIGGEISGEGALVKSGSGAVTLSNVVANSGGISVLGGTLYFNGFSPAGDNTVVATGGRIGGYGSIGGNVVIKEKGIINAGDNDISRYSRLTVDGTLELKRGAESSAPRAVFEIGTGGIYNDASFTLNPGIYDDLAGYLGSIDFSTDFEGGSLFDYNNMNGAHDQILVTGTLKLEAGALIVVDNSAGYVFSEGDMLDLMDWLGISSADWSVTSDLVLPTLTAGLQWDRSLFLSDGVLVVVAPEPGRALLFIVGLLGVMTRRRRKGGNRPCV